MSGHNTQAHNSGADEGLVGLIWRRKWKLLAVFLLCGLSAYFLSGLMRRAYRAETLIFPAQSGNSGLLGGISSLVGSSAISGLGMAQDVNKNEAMGTLTSRALIREFIKQRGIVPVLCRERAVVCYDETHGGSLAAERNMNSAVKLFQSDLLTVSEDQVTGVIRVSVVWFDRQVAADWCNGLVALTNDRVQQKNQSMAERRIAYLRQEYEKATIVPVQTAIGSLLQLELSKEMDADSRPDYAFHIIDSASAPDDRFPVRPRRAVIGVAAGCFGSLVALAVFGFLRARKARGSITK
jgi:LPS O-antigen subunit length determinant protein (WzzB/FepE family)